MNTKVLIIKTGANETFHEGDPGGACSLGDVVRTTPLLHIFEGDEVHWVTSQAAMPLLLSNPRITRVYSEEQGELEHELGLHRFDLVINLERDSHWVKWVSRLSQRSSILGFVHAGRTSHSNSLLKCQSHSDLYSVSAWIKLKCSENKPFWQDWLFGLVGKNWSHERYALTKPTDRVLHDIGLNWKVGSKWPRKAMPQEIWRQAHDLMSETFNVSWQEGFSDLRAYAAWVASCGLLLSHDSLGMHLAIAYERNILALFADSSDEQIHLYGLGQKIRFGSQSDNAQTFEYSPYALHYSVQSFYSVHGKSPGLFSGPMDKVDARLCR